MHIKIIVNFIRYGDTVGKQRRLYNKVLEKNIISLYFLQNIFCIALSLWILYIILSKLNIFINGIYLLIISAGLLISAVFIYYYPLNNPISTTNVKQVLDYTSHLGGISNYFYLFIFFYYYFLHIHFFLFV